MLIQLFGRLVRLEVFTCFQTALKPVAFHYKSDPAGARPQFGLIAEEVAEVSPDLVVRDKNGEIYTVRYDVVDAVLLNEFLKEHKTVQELKKEMAALTARLKDQRFKNPKSERPDPTEETHSTIGQ